ncbi:rhodanese-like domain-containing protein [Cohnella cholangitidis]|uniref:Rhodanese-like domain-containing protein n=1 Tax=Cohnella cholangitidis TaxID=2598458 RepID=A0A7G5BZI0_9BACL|nr:rhodanese-like domain-containing protein [Cohnella cholangitidis]QMV42364.1 rhodanese-like domain-containing protein [Cohnella cholangitidis]
MVVTSISRDEINSKLNKGEKIILVEALPKKYYDDMHLPGAINIPHDEVDRLAPQLLPDRSAEIIVYCASLPCPNSEIAAKRLMTLGYSNVKEYREGKQDWHEAGLPVVEQPR